LLLAAAARAQPAAQAPAGARPALSRGIDSLFAPFNRPRVAGGVAAVLHRGEVIHLKGYGAAQREFDVRWTADTRYRLASISKSLVATAVYRLAQQGRLRVDDPIHKFLPDFPDLGALITIDHLVTMRSGLWQDETLLALASLRGEATLAQMYELSRQQRRLNFAPGTAMAYTDTNFRLLARVIASVTGRSFWEAMRELVFEPLGMAATTADPSLHHFFDRQAPTYVGRAGDSAPPLVNVPFATSGDGSVITTMSDLIRWLQLLRADHGKAGSLFQWMTQPFAMGDGSPGVYRRGIAAFVHRGLVGWSHGGFTGTFYAFFPEIDLIVAVFANQLGAVSPAAMGRAITDLLLETEGRGRQGRVSRASEAFGPATGPLNAAEVGQLSGTFVEPVAGYVLASQAADPGGRPAGAETVRYDFLGAEVPVAAAGGGRYVSPAFVRGPRLDIRLADCPDCPAPDLLVKQTGWSEERRFVRVTPERAAASRDLVGHYWLADLGIHYAVRESAAGLELVIGAGVVSGQVLRLVPLGHDVLWGRSGSPEEFDLFALGRVSLKVVRDPAGRVSGLRLSLDRVRDLELARVR
jgi:CubicO group peptidase (beta-lactamase class C family)